MEDKHEDELNQTGSDDHTVSDPKDSPAEITVSSEEYEALKAKVKESEAIREQLLRSAADFDNARKRLSREKEEYLKFSQEQLLRQLIPLLDNFERALAHADRDKTSKGLVTGIQMVLRQFQDILKSQGMVRIESLGRKFDPHFHEAIGHVEEEGEPDVIVEEIEPGYQLQDRLLRAAKVRVRSPRGGAFSSGTEEKQDEIT